MGRTARGAWGSAILATAIAMGSGALPHAGAATARPDLIVSSIGNPPRILERGKTFGATATVRNQGTAGAGPSTLRFFLSQDRLKGATDRSIRSTRRVGKLAPGGSSRGTTTLTPSLRTPLGKYYLLACADDLREVVEKNETNNCRASSSRVEVVPGPTTVERLDAAIASKEITPTQGLVYRIFAGFGDDRVPDQYAGDDASQLDPQEALEDAAANFDSLPGWAKAKVIPFLKAPAYPGTWEELDSVSAARSPAATTRGSRVAPATDEPPMHPSPLGEHGWWFFQQQHARIWFKPFDKVYGALEEKIAGDLFEAMDTIWDAETGLMGRTPLNDKGPHHFKDPQGHDQDWGDGGNGNYDIYVIPISGLGNHGMTVAYPPGCSGRPSFTIIDPNSAVGLGGKDILAHEFMHVLQLTYKYAAPCEHYAAIDESVANWAIDYVYHGDDVEHRWDAMPWRTANLDFQYDAWTFYLYLSHIADPSIIPAIYSKITELDAWPALNAAITGGIDERWPEFMLYGWNGVPVESFFAEWDGLVDTPDLTFGANGNYPLRGHHAIQIASGSPIKLPAASLSPLGGLYYGFEFSDDVRKVVFKNGLAGQPQVHTQALLHMGDGTWQPVRDWTDVSEKTFCRDKPAEDVAELFVIISDTRYDVPYPLCCTHQRDFTSTIQGKPDCLPDRFTGALEGSTWHEGGGFEEPVLHWTGSVTWKRYPRTCIEFWCLRNGYQAYFIEAGSVDWDVSGGDVGGCSASGSGSFALLPKTDEDGNSYLEVQRHPADGHGRRHDGFVAKHELLDVTFHCPSGSFESQMSNDLWWGVTPDDQQEGPPGTDVLSGHVHHGPGNSGQVYDYTWSFGPAG